MKIIKPKTCKAPSAPFHKKFFKEVPMVDENGKPIPWNPPLTSFWDKPKKTTGNEYSRKYKKKLNK